MDKKALEAFAREAAKSIKTESDLDDFRKMLIKVTIETALNAELDEHLGYEKHASKTRTNTRNGYSSKSVITDDGDHRLMYRVTVNPASNLSSYENTKPVFNQWMTKS